MAASCARPVSVLFRRCFAPLEKMEPVAAGGIITILFTDLVDSTGLIERLGDDTAERLTHRHFEILRQALADTGGREVKSTGDGVMAAFPSALAALDAAVRMQRAVPAEPGDPLGLRVGIHAGEPIPDGDDYFGQT